MVHECATRALARWLLRAGARRTGREIHLVILDTPPDEARHDQHRRGRVIGGASFRTHVHRWDHLREAAEAPGAEACTVLPGARSAVLLDRAAASALTAIDFLG